MKQQPKDFSEDMLLAIHKKYLQQLTFLIIDKTHLFIHLYDL